MAEIQTVDGQAVTIGVGYPSSTTWGDTLRVVDPPIPVRDYSGNPTEPLKLWKTQPSLRKVVSFAARQFASIPWHVYERVDDTDRQRRAGSPVETILERPAPMVTGYQLMQDLASDRMIFDACCALLIDDELVRIPPGLLRWSTDRLGRPRELVILMTDGGDPIDITEAAKIATWGWHPRKSAGGVTPMTTLAAILNESKRAVDWRAAQWDNAPKVSGILKRPASAKKWDERQRDRFIETWRTWRSSAAGGTPILEDGMEYEPIDSGVAGSAKLRDIDGRRLTDAEVASAFHIPPELVGARAGNFSNINAFRQMLFGPTLGPMFTEIQQAINHGGIVEALDSTPGLYVEANREAAMAGGFFEQARILQTAVGGPFMTRAEARARLNLPRLDGTEELITPLNVLEGGQASPTDSGTQNEGSDDPTTDN